MEPAGVNLVDIPPLLYVKPVFGSLIGIFISRGMTVGDLLMEVRCATWMSTPQLCLFCKRVPLTNMELPIAEYGIVDQDTIVCALGPWPAVGGDTESGGVDEARQNRS